MGVKRRKLWAFPPTARQWLFAWSTLAGCGHSRINRQRACLVRKNAAVVSIIILEFSVRVVIAAVIAVRQSLGYNTRHLSCLHPQGAQGYGEPNNLPPRGTHNRQHNTTTNRHLCGALGTRRQSTTHTWSVPWRNSTHAVAIPPRCARTR